MAAGYQLGGWPRRARLFNQENVVDGKESKLFKFEHLCRGDGKVYLVVTVADSLEGCRIETESRTGDGKRVPARVMPWRANRLLLIVPILRVAQTCEVRAFDQAGSLAGECPWTIHPRVAQLLSVVNRVRGDKVISETRDFDERLGNDGFEILLDRVVPSCRPGYIAHGVITLQGDLVDRYGDNPQFRVLDGKGDETLIDDLIIMRNTRQEHPEYPGVFVRRVQFSVHVGEAVDSLVISPKTVGEGQDAPYSSSEPFCVIERWKFKTVFDIWHEYMQSGFFSDEKYDEWYRNYHAVKQVELSFQAKQRFEIEPVFSIVVPLYETPVEFLDDMVESVIGQSYAKFELVLVNSSPADEALCERVRYWAGRDERIAVVNLEENYGITENTNRGIEAARGDFLCFLDHDDMLAADALYRYAKALNDYPETDLLYSDEDKIKDGLHCDPYFKPDWDPELMTGMNYVCHFLCVRKCIVDELDPATSEYDGAQDYHMTLRVSERARNVFHARRVLYHWRIHDNSTSGRADAKPYAIEAGWKAVQSHIDRCGMNGTVVQHPLLPDRCEVRFAIEGDPLVSIVIPNKDNVEVLDRCLRSVVERTTYQNYEVIVVENNSTEQETFDYYDRIPSLDGRIRVERFEGAFNFSAVNNFGMAHANGDYFVLLNNDVEVISSDWIERMLGLCMVEGVGAVGAKLLYPDRTVQHVGVIGMPTGPSHVNLYLDCDMQGYYGTNVMRRDLNVVTAACLMTPREAFERVGGMDEAFAVDYNDVDFCLALRNAGYRIVIDPAVNLFHYESVSRGFHASDESKERFVREQGMLKQKWPKYYAFADTYGNPNFDQTSLYFQCPTV